MPSGLDGVREGDRGAALRTPRVDGVAAAQPLKQRQAGAGPIGQPGVRKAGTVVGNRHLELSGGAAERDVDAPVRLPAVGVDDRVRADLGEHQLEVVEIFVSDRQAGCRADQRLPGHRQVGGVGGNRQRGDLFEAIR